MGSYAECWAGKFYVGSTKNDVDPSLMLLFRASDKKIITSSKANIPDQLGRWTEYIKEEEDVNVVYYSAPAKTVKARLELTGYSLKNSTKAYARYLECETSRYEELIEGDYGDAFKPTLEILREMNLDKWLSTLKDIHENELVHNKFNRENDDGTLLSYMLQEDWYGFPGVDINVALRLSLEVIPEDENFIYDVTDLIINGYFDVNADLVEYAANISLQNYYNNSKCIILTEGKSDTLVLSKSLGLLYPYLADYFTFMDFDGAKVGGGAGILANMVKSFSGAGIINKVVAVFDNDTAAHAALRALKNAKISKNIKIFTLPNLDILSDYPTIGPSGMINMNINGSAGSIELYLGQECILNSEGEYYPIQWTGLDASLQKFQGEITEKDSVQKRFQEKVQRCTEDKLLIDNFDWHGIKSILEGIFILFHEDDGRQIMSWAEEYYR